MKVCRVVTLLSQLLSDANFFCCEFAIDGPSDDVGANRSGGASKAGPAHASSMWMPNPDLTLLRSLGKSVLIRANKFAENYIPDRMKPVLELTCVAEIIHRATRSPEWMYGDVLSRNTPVSVPLTPRLVSCPPCKDWLPSGFHLGVLTAHHKWGKAAAGGACHCQRPRAPD